MDFGPWLMCLRFKQNKKAIFKIETPEKVKDILVVRQHNQIGDMLCSLTLYKALKKKYPDSRITLVAAKTNYEIPFFDFNPYLDRVIVYNKSSLKTVLKFIKELRNRKYQIGIVPSTIVLSRTSHIINRISGATVRVGVKSIDRKVNESHKYLNVKADFNWKETHQTERNLQVVKQIGCDLSEGEKKSIRINLSAIDLSLAKEFFKQNFPDKNRSVIAIHPGAGKEANLWDLNNFIKLIKKIYKKYNNYVLITSGWTDEEIVGQICKELTLANIDFKILHKESVKKLGAILSMTDLYITNDTGTMHIAGYSGAKMISLFGPTNPAEWAPIGKNQKYIKSAGEDINSISVDEVFTLVENFLFDNKK